MLKRARYIHSVYDTGTSQHLLVNLLNQQLLAVIPERYPLFESVLAAPNDEKNQNSEALGVALLLESLGFLIPHNRNEIAELEARFWKEKRDPTVLSLGIVLTQRCNFRCTYCNQEHLGSSFTAEDAKRVQLMFATAAPQLSKFSVTWWGGEPLLQLPRIRELSTHFIEECDRRSIAYSAFTSTNGSLITPQIASELRDLRLTKFQISLDGPRKLHDSQRPLVKGKGSYDLVLRGIASLVEAYGPVANLITLRVHGTSSLCGREDEWDSFIEDLSPYRESLNLHFIPAHETFRFEREKTISNSEMRSRLAGIIERFKVLGFTLAEKSLLTQNTLMHCGAVSDRAWFVLPGSRLTRCNNAFNEPKNDCGIIHEDGNVELFAKADKWLGFSPFRFEECRECDVLPVCMGGCNIVDFSHTSGARCHIRDSIRETIRSDPRKYRFSGSGCTGCSKGSTQLTKEVSDGNRNFSKL